MCASCIVAKSVSLVFFASSHFASASCSLPDSNDKKPTVDINVNVSREATNPTRL